VVRDGAMLRLPGHEARLTREDERLWERVRPLLAAAELRPPRVRELAATLGLEPEPLTRFLKRVERFGRVAPVAANRVFLPETIARLADLAAALAEDSPERSFTASGFKDRCGIGRNLTIEVLEYLDAIGVTRRVGDARIVLRSTAELFG
jgi:selenocysteine-specific elongation factor